MLLDDRIDVMTNNLEQIPDGRLVQDERYLVRKLQTPPLMEPDLAARTNLDPHHFADLPMGDVALGQSEWACHARPGIGTCNHPCW